MEENEREIDYNEEPVCYCADCLSLRIRNIESFDIEYCDICGSTSVSTTDIHSWEDKYFTKYGHSYLKEKTKK